MSAPALKHISLEMFYAYLHYLLWIIKTQLQNISPKIRLVIIIQNCFFVNHFISQIQSMSNWKKMLFLTLPRCLQPKTKNTNAEQENIITESGQWASLHKNSSKYSPLNWHMPSEDLRHFSAISWATDDAFIFWKQWNDNEYLSLQWRRSAPVYGWTFV